MQTNTGQVDRVLRAILGLAILTVIFVFDGPSRWWGLIGLLPLGTAIFGYCPAYSIFGINTCGKAPTAPPTATPKA